MPKKYGCQRMVVTPFRLTNAREGSSYSPKWSPGGKWIAFLSNREKEIQLQAIRAEGGEAIQIGNTQLGISDYECSAYSSEIAFLQTENKAKEKEQRKDLYGGFEVEDAEYSPQELWLLTFDPAISARNPLPSEMKDTSYTEMQEARRLLDSVDYSINGLAWSPDGGKIAIGHQPNPLINTFFKADISIYDIRSETVNPVTAPIFSDNKCK